MPPLSRLFPTSRPTHGDNGDRIRADYLDASLVPVVREHENLNEQNTSSGTQSTVQGSYKSHGMALPQMPESKKRTGSVKRREKSLPSRSHSRSFSQFFGGSKKKFLGIDSDTDSSDEDGFGASNTGPSSASKGKRALSAKDGEPSFETGKCMTCHSKVRWPKSLKLYRCTVCSCVNDLEPRNPAELHKVKEVDQATWRKINARYPGLKFPDAPCFALAAREARDIADRCMHAYIEAVRTPIEQQSAMRDARRPSADANANLAIRRKPLPVGGDRRPSAGTLPPLPVSSPLLTPPHLTDVKNPFNNHDFCSSPEDGASPRKFLSRQAEPDGLGIQAGTSRQTLLPPPPERKPPPPPLSSSLPNRSSPGASARSNHSRTFSTEGHDQHASRPQGPSSTERLKAAFTPLEVYLKWSYANFESINNAFSTARRPTMLRTKSDGPCDTSSHEGAVPPQAIDVPTDQAWYLSQVDGKTLLVGDVAENATLWTGAANGSGGQREINNRTFSEKGSNRLVTHKSPCIDWDAAREWYHAVLEAGQRWQQKRSISDLETASVEAYLQKLLFRATESLLRRPGKPLNEPEDIRFLMIMLVNPLLHRQSSDQGAMDRPPTICKKMLGLLARSGKRALRYLDGWLVNLDNDRYSDLLSLCKRYMHYRLLRDIVPDEGKKDIWSPEARPGQDPTTKGAQKTSGNNNDDGEADTKLSYFDDWGLSSAAAFMFSLWNANLCRQVRLPCNSWYNLFFDSMGEAAIKQDFTAWESRKPTFAFCYFPFLVSMSAKITILTFDANRQQMDEARKAWHQQFNTAAVVSQNLNVEVRRECLANDSLRSISEAAGSASHHKELKKGLRIRFKGEEGVDAGGLRKEFFLLLLRELLDPNHGLVEYDEQSNYCYFNPNSFEESAQYSLLGTLVGLAIYNGTILDIPFPPLLFKKLLRRDTTANHSEGEGVMSNSNALDPSLDDLAQWRPTLARGFRQLLEYDGNVEEDLALTFAVETDRYGSRASIPLAGKPVDTPVTSKNRAQYVRTYMQYLMHDSVSRQFEPFKLGFLAVCGGNALSLFQPEELELLVRGSDEALDVDVLRAVAAYEGWTTPEPAESVPVIRWFWDFFASLGHKDQRKLLGFITGSDRVPALGEANLTIKLQYAGPEKDRLPVARTCFNALQLYPYEKEEVLREKLWRAVTDSEGFLLK